MRSSTVEFSQSVSKIQTLRGQTSSKNVLEIMLTCQQNTGMNDICIHVYYVAASYFHALNVYSVSENPAEYRYCYNSYAAAVTEVEIDVLTGESQVLRVDILYDCGTRSLS